MGDLYCPTCGSEETTRMIESIHNGDEYKESWTCDQCQNLWYMIVTEKENKA